MAETSLIDYRPQAYETLFLGEMVYERRPPETEVGVAGLLRLYTETRGRRSTGNVKLVEQRVGHILQQHDTNARQPGREDDALFGLIDPTTDLPLLIELTSAIMTRWNKALLIRQEPPFFSDDQDEWPIPAVESLVLETASATLKVLPFMTGRAPGLSAAQKANVVQVVAKWGPDFVESWISGAILEEWLTTHGLPAEEIAYWKKEITPGYRKIILNGSITDPLPNLKKLKQNLELLADDNLIAEQMGWSVQEVTDFFLPSHRKELAIAYLSNPLASLVKIKANMALLTEAKIAELLGWSLPEVQDIFSLSVRRRIAVNNVRHPLSAVEQVKHNLTILSDRAIARETGWDQADVHDFFTPGLRRRYAIKNLANPLLPIRRISQNMTLLSDDNIAQRLNCTPDQARQNISVRLRRYFAIHNQTDPLNAIERYQRNLTGLTDEAIASRLGWTAARARATIDESMRKYVAATYITDPMQGIEDFAGGKIDIKFRFLD